MDLKSNALEQIFEQLKTKSCLKQKTYSAITDVFVNMRNEAQKLAVELSDRIEEVDSSVKVEFTDVSEFEFHLKFSGDMLVFVKQTNIVTFPDEHPVVQNDYVKEDPDRRYFGHIMVYNFLADSIKLNRLQDPGYLLARLLVNSEGHFFAEGVSQLNFLFTDIISNIINEQWIRLLIEKAVSVAIDIDLIAPNYPDISSVTLGQKMSNTELMGRGEKIGFQMSHEQ